MLYPGWQKTSFWVIFAERFEALHKFFRINKWGKNLLKCAPIGTYAVILSSHSKISQFLFQGQNRLPNNLPRTFLSNVMVTYVPGMLLRNIWETKIFVNLTICLFQMHTRVKYYNLRYAGRYRTALLFSYPSKQWYSYAKNNFTFLLHIGGPFVWTSMLI